MKPRARIVLAISFALLSTGSIVTCVTTGPAQRPSHPLDKLRKFDTRFHDTINKAIHSPDATTFAIQRCESTFVDHRIQNIASGEALCPFNRSEAKALRSKVDEWIDTFFLQSAALQDTAPDPLPGCTIDATWFLMRVDLTVVRPGTVTDGDRSDAGDGGGR